MAIGTKHVIKTKTEKALTKTLFGFWNFAHTTQLDAREQREAAIAITAKISQERQINLRVMTYAYDEKGDFNIIVQEV